MRSVAAPTGYRRSVTMAVATLLMFGCRSVGTAAIERSEHLSLKGAWRLVETAVRLPGQPWDARRAPQGGLFVFSARHYSYFYVRGMSPRPKFNDANRPTDAERAATFDTFIAGAGSYTFDGRAARLSTDFRKNPNEMTGELWQWQAEAVADTLRFVFENPPFLPGRHWRLTLIRVE